MDKDYHKERKFIAERADAFSHYLQNEVLSPKACRLLEEVVEQTNVYIFSGIIRNFLLGLTENRDVDVVVDNIKSLSISAQVLQDCEVTVNSFGGYKIHIDHLTVDAWGIESTWGLLHENMRTTPNSLIKTAFFNFSSVAFDYVHKKFIYDTEICRFLRTNFMDVVYATNPNPTLCILNTTYYAQKYNFPIAYKLCKWLMKYYKNTLPFAEVQEKHFHKQIVSSDSLSWMMETIKNVKLEKGKGVKLDFVQRQATIEFERDMAVQKNGQLMY